MPKLRVHNYCMSVDGFVAGPDQALEDPFGKDSGGLTEWVFRTRYGKEMTGRDPGDAPRILDDDFMDAGVEGIGATVMGRNMFGPIRGEWGDDEWKGWWGPNPPYHHPVFVLTHHPRDPFSMEGGTRFHFITDGIESALEQAFVAAEGKDVRLGGGCSAVQQYLRAGLVDDLHIVITPTLLGRGERLFDGLDALPTGYEVAEVVPSPVPSSVTHVRITKTA